MNFAFQALVILAFISPGLIFRNRYNRGRWNYPLGRLGSVTEQLPKALVVAALFNLVWCIVVEGLIYLMPRCIPKIDYNAAVYWLSNSVVRDPAIFNESRRALVCHPFYIFLYFAGLYVVSFFLGIAAHEFIRHGSKDHWSKHGLDKIFRYDNDWYYILTGEALDFTNETYGTRPGMLRREMPAKDRKATAVAAVMDGKEGAVLYVGILVDFFFDDDGNLDRLLLTGVRRRLLGPGEELEKSLQDDPIGEDGGTPPSILSSYLEVERFYPISGHFFVMRMSEIKTLNIDYLNQEEVDELGTLTRRSTNWLKQRYREKVEKVEAEAARRRAGEGEAAQIDRRQLKKRPRSRLGGLPKSRPRRPRGEARERRPDAGE